MYLFIIYFTVTVTDDVNFHLVCISFTSTASRLPFFIFFVLVCLFLSDFTKVLLFWSDCEKFSVQNLKVENCSVYIYIAIAFSISAAFYNCCRVFLILPWKCLKDVLNFTIH